MTSEIAFDFLPRVDVFIVATAAEHNGSSYTRIKRLGHLANNSLCTVPRVKKDWKLCKMRKFTGSYSCIYISLYTAVEIQISC
jgi:hypothetical protein